MDRGIMIFIEDTADGTGGFGISCSAGDFFVGENFSMGDLLNNRVNPVLEGKFFHYSPDSGVQYVCEPMHAQCFDHLYGRLHIGSSQLLHFLTGGGTGIRTLEGGKPLHAFQACALGRSAIPPKIKDFRTTRIRGTKDHQVALNRRSTVQINSFW